MGRRPRQRLGDRLPGHRCSGARADGVLVTTALRVTAISGVLRDSLGSMSRAGSLKSPDGRTQGGNHCLNKVLAQSRVQRLKRTCTFRGKASHARSGVVTVQCSTDT